MGREGLEGPPGIDGLQGKDGSKGLKVGNLRHTLTVTQKKKKKCFINNHFIYYFLRESKETMGKWAYLVNQETRGKPAQQDILEFKASQDQR